MPVNVSELSHRVMIEIPGYTLKKSIGRGGMGVVYLATQKMTGRAVAIKVMAPNLAADSIFSRRFLKEAYCANLSHQNIVTIFDAGQVDDNYYLIMEYLQGQDLVTRIKQGIAPEQCVEIVSQIADALHYAWGKGYVHRDVKPANILFREEGMAVLVDFGIAKIISESTNLTLTGSMVGSPKFISPERIYGVEPDNRSDLYSLGAVFFQMLTGRVPYDGPTVFAITYKQVHEPIPRLADELSVYQSIIDRLLAKNPNDRYADANQFREAINALLTKKTTVDRRHSGMIEVVATDRHFIDLQHALIDDVPTIALESTPKPKRGFFRLMVAGILLVGGVLYWPELDDYNPFLTATDNTSSDFQSETQSPSQSVLTIEPAFAESFTKAETYLEQRAYTSPPGANAYDIYQEILELDADNPRALAGLETIVSGYIVLIKDRIKHGDIIRALIFTDKGLKINATHPRLLSLKSELEIRFSVQ